MLGFAAVWPRQLLVPGRAGPRLHLRAELRPSLLHARGSGGAPGGPALDPAAIAASVAERLTLTRPHPDVASRDGSHRRDSLVLARPRSQVEELTVSLAGETVTVTAEPSGVEWRFGDGMDLSGGPGRPYRRGRPPADAVLHMYAETRCLPGDHGRNPYVLGSCGSTGYPLEAMVVWRISFSATGPIDASGTLPTRTTETSTRIR